MLGKFNKSAFILIAISLLSLGGGRLISNPQLSQIGSYGTYLFAGPASFVISKAILSAELVLAHQKPEYQSGEEIINQLEPYCKNIIIHKTLLLELITTHYSKLSNEHKGLSSDQQTVAFDSMIKSLDSCQSLKPNPHGFNILWAFQPTVIFEGAIITTLDLLLKRVFYRTAYNITNARLGDVEEDPNNSIDINQLRIRLKSTHAYQLHQAFENSIVKTLL